MHEKVVMTAHCLITGGASGMGAATARLAAQSGYSISVVSLEEEREAAEQLVSQIQEGGASSAFFAADVAIEDDVVQAYKSAAELFGPPTGVMHSAGVFVSAPVRELDFEQITRMIAINVTGLMIGCREAIRLMSPANGGSGGSIVNISSMAATIGGRPGHSVYAASKGAVDVFSKGIAKEVAIDGIRVNTIRPGAVASPMTAGMEANPELKKAVEASIPNGRLGTAEEIADITLWLMSPESSLVTGARLDAGGGGFHVAGAL